MKKKKKNRTKQNKNYKKKRSWEDEDRLWLIDYKH